MSEAETKEIKTMIEEKIYKENNTKDSENKENEKGKHTE